MNKTMRLGTVLTTLGVTLLSISAVVAALYVLGRDGGVNRQASAASISAVEAGAVTNDVIAFFQGRVEGDPVDFISYTKLGEAYLRQARETGDISAYERAEAAFTAAIELFPDHLAARAGLASVRFALHDFRGALNLATQVYDADPGATQALATIADAHVALGEYDEASGWYAQLDAAVDGPAIDSRLAHLTFLSGDTDRAIELMRRAVDSASRTSRPGESLAWYRSQLGELYFSRGDYGAAEDWYAASLAGFDGYYPALAGLGAAAAARGDDAQAIDYYEQSVAVVPLPISLAALGDLYTRAGDTAKARDRYDTVEFIGTLEEINRNVYNRELALFYADHGIHTSEAAGFALAELDVRRDIYGYDAAAWALYADGRAQEALPYMEQALQFGTQDARLYYHAGMISKALGQDEQARAYLSQALEINPHFSVLHDDAARQALAQLER
jgi:tetratricopeptide (TPR) repeat protein